MRSRAHSGPFELTSDYPHNHSGYYTCTISIWGRNPVKSTHMSKVLYAASYWTTTQTILVIDALRSD